MYAWHPATAIVPMASPKELEALEDSIKSRGVREPVEIFDGQIIDGRARQEVCVRLGKHIPIRVISTDDPVRYVIDKNLKKRAFPHGALALMGQYARAEYIRTGKEVMGLREWCGRLVAVGGAAVDRARVVTSTGVPELIEAVFEGRVRIATAAEIAGLDPDDQRAIVAAKNIDEQLRLHRKATKDAPVGRPTSNGKDPVGVMIANEALNVLMRIPRSDPLRERGFKIVMDWIKKNR